MHEQGIGVDQDLGEAVNWYRRAAEQGYVAAQYSLGVGYYKGDGLPQDHVLAHVWANVAATNGYADAVGVRNIITEQLSASDLATAEQIALRCLGQGYQTCVR